MEKTRLAQKAPGGSCDKNQTLNMKSLDKTFTFRGTTFTLESVLYGWINIYGIIGSQLIQERYMDYTEREAKALFKKKYIKPNS